MQSHGVNIGRKPIFPILKIFSAMIIYLKINHKIYYITMNKNIFIIHNNWKGKCIIDYHYNKIYRVEDKDEYGCYNIDKNKLTIK